jgi:hypothetical protein
VDQLRPADTSSAGSGGVVDLSSCAGSQATLVTVLENTFIVGNPEPYQAWILTMGDTVCCSQSLLALSLSGTATETGVPPGFVAQGREASAARQVGAGGLEGAATLVAAG